MKDSAGCACPDAQAPRMKFDHRKGAPYIQLLFVRFSRGHFAASTTGVGTDNALDACIRDISGRLPFGTGSEPGNLC